MCVLNLSVKIICSWLVSYKSTLVESTLFELLGRELSNGSWFFNSLIWKCHGTALFMVVHFALHLGHLVVLATPRFFSMKSGNFFFFLTQMIFYFFLEKNKLKALYVFHSSVRKCSCIKNWHYLELQDLIYPVPELWYPGIDSGLVFFSTTNTPTNDTRKHESSVLSLNNHWSATVTLKLLIVIL